MALTFAMQSLMRWACDRLKGFWRVAAADLFLFLSFIGTVNVWRGVWQLCDLYFLKGTFHLIPFTLQNTKKNCLIHRLANIKQCYDA